MTRLIASVLAACALAGAGAASAESRIPFGDLDLATTEGAATFDARVETAARQFCRATGGAISPLAERTACEREFRKEAFSLLPDHAQVRYAVSRLPVVA